MSVQKASGQKRGKSRLASAASKLVEAHKFGARRRAIVRKGKKGISVETVLKIVKGTEKQSGGKQEEGFKDRLRTAFDRLVVKTALDALGIMNTKKDPGKRRRIQEIKTRMGLRYRSSEGLRAGRKTDAVWSECIADLRRELGGKAKTARFLSSCEKISRDINQKLNQYKEDSKAN